MLTVDITENKKFLILLDKGHEHYERAYVLVRSLLTAQEVKPDCWVVGYDDLLYFKDKLNDCGLKNTGKTITPPARDWLDFLSSVESKNLEIKSGTKNAETQQLLTPLLKSSLFEDQLTGVAYLMNSKRVGLFDAMGAGKTLEALATIVGLQGEISKTLIIAPKGVLPGFTREIAKHTNLTSVSLPTGRKKALEFLQKNAKSDWDILLVHPENLVGEKNNKFSPILHTLVGMPWDMVVIDEFHKYKNVEAKRTQCIIRIVTEVKNRKGGHARAIMMTGTPVPESPVNAYVFLKLTNFGRLPNINRFENYFTIKENIDYGVRGIHPKIVGYKNLDLLKSMIERRSIRRTKDDLKGFPDEVTLIRDVYLRGKQEDLYRALKGQLRDSLPKESRINLMQILQSNAVAIRMRQLLNHPSFLNEDGESAKFVELGEMLEELFTDPTAKALVWTEYRHGVDLVHRYFNDAYGVLKIYGGVEIDENLIKTFEAQGGPRIAAVIPAKGGEGLDFLARARTAFYLDRPYSFTLYSQSLDRIHRRVSPVHTTWLDHIKAQPANLVFLDAVGTVDELVRATLSGKKDLSDALLIDDEKLMEIGREDLLAMLR
jgi:SNF2 family DNA or RNA helicase